MLYNAKPSAYYFSMKTKILVVFHICISVHIIKQAISIYNFKSNENDGNRTETAASNQYHELNVYTSEVKPAVPNTSHPTISWNYYSSWNKINCHIA